MRVTVPRRPLLARRAAERARRATRTRTPAARPRPYVSARTAATPPRPGRSKWGTRPSRDPGILRVTTAPVFATVARTGVEHRTVRRAPPVTGVTARPSTVAGRPVRAGAWRENRPAAGAERRGAANAAGPSPMAAASRPAEGRKSHIG